MHKDCMYLSLICHAKASLVWPGSETQRDFSRENAQIMTCTTSRTQQVYTRKEVSQAKSALKLGSRFQTHSQETWLKRPVQHMYWGLWGNFYPYFIEMVWKLKFFIPPIILPEAETANGDAWQCRTFIQLMLIIEHASAQNFSQTLFQFVLTVKFQWLTWKCVIFKGQVIPWPL